MPRTKTYLTASEYAVLGLLRQRPAYGYELQRRLGGRTGLARVCPVEPAMVYAILKSLSGLELIDGEWDSSSYPPRAVYAATAEGDAAFLRWLRQPVGRMREVRSDFMIKYPIEPEGYDRPPIDIVDRMSRYGTTHCGTLELTQMIMTGLFDRFPALKIYWAENEIGWVPIYLEQMDLIYEANRHWIHRILGVQPLAQRSDLTRRLV